MYFTKKYTIYKILFYAVNIAQKLSLIDEDRGGGGVDWEQIESIHGVLIGWRCFVDDLAIPQSGYTKF